MADTNKVLFGFSDLYVGTYTVASDGTVTLGTPYHQKGAVGFSPEESSDNNIFYADNIAYYTSYNTGTHEGDLTVAKFDDEFKTKFLDYITLDDGGLAQVKGKARPSVYLMYAIQGDSKNRKVIFYNGTFGPIRREEATIEDVKTPITEVLTATFVGDNATGITKVTYNEGDAGYATLFTNPPVPALPATS